jgi:predicted acylesterase/phospholipase RssA
MDEEILEQKEIEEQYNVEEEIEKKDTPIIKHLVIPGGGTTGMIAYGALKETHESGVWNIENIESIYGTSAGAIVGVILALKYDWKTLDEYLIKRPWQNICNFNMYAIIESFQKRGIFNIDIIKGIFSPLFLAKDIEIDVTLEEFYKITKIELHFYTSDLNAFKLVDISHKTHPDWNVIEAIYASACLPIFFAPFEKDGKYYADGGIFLNYPLSPCIKCGNKPEEILAIWKRNIEVSQDKVTSESTLFDYVLILLNKTLHNIIMSSENIMHTQNEIEINCPFVSIYDLYKMSSSVEERTRLIEEGMKSGRLYCIKGTYGSPSG